MHKSEPGGVGKTSLGWGCNGNVSSDDTVLSVNEDAGVIILLSHILIFLCQSIINRE
jgi:hypothetical protein